MVLRSDLLKNVKRIVVKVGSSILTTDTGYLSIPKVNQLVNGILDLKQKHGKEVILVSSGAIACGMDMLKFVKRPRDLASLQAAASVGQGKLINTYKKSFSKNNVFVGQILLTIDGLHNRTRYLNARNTINELLNLNVVPIVNENDTVATEEIRFGDNDNLAAQVAMMTGADLLIILSDVDGFCVKDNNKMLVMHTIDKADQGLRQHLTKIKRGTTVGGMESKLDIGFKLIKLGLPLIIANGNDKNVLSKIVVGDKIGTIFVPKAKPAGSKKRWLAFTATQKKAGTLVVDDGAFEALSKKGKSLLASGIVRVLGDFKFGSSVNISKKDGTVFAKGIVNYASAEIDLIKGKKTSEIRAVLGSYQYDELVHRNNMIVL